MDRDEIKECIKTALENGQLEEAAQIIEQYKKIIGYDDEIASMEAIIEIYSGNYDKALAAIIKGLQINIKNDDLYYTMGNIYECKQKYNQAYLCYEHALTLSTKNADIIVETVHNLQENYSLNVKNYSVVIFADNNLEYTKVCLGSIRKYNGNEGCEIIVIADYNCDDKTIKYLESQKGIKYIVNDSEKTIEENKKIAFNLADKDNDIFLINNSCIIMVNSIFNLRMGLYSDELIGFSAPIRNISSYNQHLCNESSSFNDLELFSQKNNVTDEKRISQTLKIDKLPVMVKRSVYQQNRIESIKKIICNDSYIYSFKDTDINKNLIIDIVLVYAYGRGGLEDVITNVSKTLISFGHKVRIFQAARPKFTEWEKTLEEVYYYGEGLSLESDLRVFSQKYADIISEIGEPDVILATHAPSITYMCSLAKNQMKKNIPVISWLHGPIDYFGGRSNLQFADAHLAISEGLQKDISQTILPDNIYLVDNPVNIRNIEKIETSKEKLELVYVGRLSNKEKRIDVLLMGLAKVTGEWKLHVIGDGPDKEYYIELAKKLNINDSIVWYGWQDRPWSVVKKATALVLTSDFEGFGLVVIEALSRGIPVISTDAEGPSKIINDDNGWLIKRGDFNALANLLNKIQKGEEHIPDPEVCINSVQKYDVFNVTKNIEKVIVNEYYKKINSKTIDIVLWYLGGKGGVESVVKKVYAGLKAKGHKVRIFQPWSSKSVEWERDFSERYYYGLDLKEGASLQDYAIAYRKLLDNIGMPDVILATHLPQMSYLCKYAVSIFREESIPVISWIHNPIAIFGEGAGECLKYADFNLAIGETIYNDIKKIISSEKVSLVNNPVSVKNQKFIERHNDTLELIYVGRIENSQKRLDIIFKALSKVHGDWKLNIIGDGEDRSKLEELSYNLKIADKICWRGWISNPWEAIDKASLLLVASDYEGFGLVMVEALSRGIPVLSTKNEGSCQLIDDNKNGWLVERGDYNKMSQLLNSILNGDINLPSQEECHKSVLCYDDDVVIDKIEKSILSTCRRIKCNE